MNDLKKTIAYNMELYLTASGMTQKELAERTEVTEGSVSMWLNGTTIPRFPKLEKICEALHCNVSDLTDRERTVDYVVNSRIVFEIEAELENINQQGKERILSYAKELSKIYRTGAEDDQNK